MWCPDSRGKQLSSRVSSHPFCNQKPPPLPFSCWFLTDVLDVLTGDACATSLPPTAHLMTRCPMLCYLGLGGVVGVGGSAHLYRMQMRCFCFHDSVLSADGTPRLQNEVTWTRGLGALVPTTQVKIWTSAFSVIFPSPAKNRP